MDESERIPRPKLKRDWEGRYVRLKKQMTTGLGDIFLEGEVMKVERNYGGLHLVKVVNCRECKRLYRGKINDVSENAVELLSRSYKPEWSATIILNPERLAAIQMAASDISGWQPMRDIMKAILEEVGQ